MKYVLLVIIAVFFSILIMIGMTMAYNFFGEILPAIAVVMIISGLIIGLWNAIKNTVIAAREVYGKK